MTTAKDLAEKSKITQTTAAIIAETGGVWDHESCSYLFPDSSRGAFTKHAVELNGKFSHYQFEEIL